MDNPRFVDKETIPLFQDEDYDNYGTPDTSGVEETSFSKPATTQATSTLQLNQNVKRGQLVALYRHLKVRGNLDLIDLDRFMRMTDPKNVATIFEFYNGDRQVPLRKETCEFFAQKASKDKLGGLNTMKKFLVVDKTPSSLEISFKDATKLKG